MYMGGVSERSGAESCGCMCSCACICTWIKIKFLSHQELRALCVVLIYMHMYMGRVSEQSGLRAVAMHVFSCVYVFSCVHAINVSMKTALPTEDHAHVYTHSLD